MNKKSKTNIINYVKASRHGEWLAKNEDAKGFISIHKVYKSKKKYTRKNKHKNESYC